MPGITSRCQSGFTLIELSIVLVIIGLIVGGVLVGQDLIKAAEIRATVTQIERYSTAVHTFRNKYNGLPGDLVNPTYFFPSVTGADSATPGLANGDGLIHGSSFVPLQIGLNGEAAVFWYELSQANLIPERITNSNLATQVYPVIDASVLPPAKLGKGNYLHVGTAGGINYLILGNFTGPTTAATGVFATINTQITPSEAFQLDSKMDDGLPTTGTVVSTDGSTNATLVTVGGTANATGALAAGDCYDNTLNIYATNAAATQDTNGCILRIRASF